VPDCKLVVIRAAFWLVLRQSLPISMICQWTALLGQALAGQVRAAHSPTRFSSSPLFHPAHIAYAGSHGLCRMITIRSD